MSNSQTPKEKVINYAKNNTTGSLVDFSLADIEKFVDIALEEQARQIFEELDEKVSAFRLKRTGQQEVSMMVRELKDKWLK